MNTLQSLLDNGIEEYTANRMLEDYKRRIGTMNGIYKIIDINYDFTERGKDITLECSECGNTIHRTMVSGRNKWSELIKNCPCQKEEKLRQRELDFQKSEKIKKDIILKRIGKIYGDYKIISTDETGGKLFYTMQCNICGAEKKISADNFEKRKNFHCSKHYKPPIKYDESYIGRKKNFLKVIGIERTDKNRKKFVCQCDCGEVKQIEPAMWELEIIKSCGCKSKELSRNAIKKHGLSKTRLYSIWHGMNDRCFNPKNKNYLNYGGRGIKVCKEWSGENELFNFIDWANNNGYADDLTIDRINVNGNYEPSNCRWADIITQANNKRPTEEWKKRELKTWTIDGEVKTIGEWCEQYDISTVTISYRMKKLGMTLEQALKTPKFCSGRPKTQFTKIH